MKKFELSNERIANIFGKKLFPIKTFIKFGNRKEGKTGGFIEKEEKLSHDGGAWG